MRATVKIENVLESIGLKSKVTTGVALGGGGARGFQHVGVLRAMAQFGMTPDILSGVSAGSIAAVLYGAGLTSEEIIQCFMEQAKMNKFTEWSVPKVSFLRLNRFAKLLDSWLPVKNLEDLRIPTVVCATDFDKGTSVGWSKGEIVPRVVASCSIPIVFPPVIIRGTHYVDGGVLRNLPAWAIRKHCKLLVGSNCSPLSRDFKYRAQVLDIALRSYQLMAKSNTLQDLNLCDYVVQPPEVSQYKTFDLTSIRKIVDCGYDAACKVFESKLKK